MASMAADPTAADAADIHPDRTLWLLSIAHAVNHAQAVLLPLVYLRIIVEFNVSPSAVAYLAAGLFVRESLVLLPWILPSLLVGVLLGAVVIQHVRSETFRRLCMSFDAWIVSFGVSVLLRQLHLIDGAGAFGVVMTVVAIDVWLLYRFFSRVPMRVVTHAA